MFISFLLALFVFLVALATEVLGVKNAGKTAKMYGLNVPSNPIIWHQVLLRPFAAFFLVWALAEFNIA